MQQQIESVCKEITSKFVTLNINIWTFNKLIENYFCGVLATTSHYLFCTFIKVVTFMFIGLANLDWWLLTSSWWCVKVTCKLELKKRFTNLRTILNVALFDGLSLQTLFFWIFVLWAKYRNQERKLFCFRNIPFRRARIS